MDKLLEAISKFVELTHPEKVRQLAAELKKTATSRNKKRLLRSFQSTAQSKQLWKCVLDEWDEEYVSPIELSGFLIGASYGKHEAKNAEKIELVWTGPVNEIVPVRQTSSVVREVISKATKTLFLVSYVVNDICGIENNLKEAISRGVRISILTESGKERGGNLDYDPGDVIAKILPGAAILYWPKEKRFKDGQLHLGSVHAKCIIADKQTAFITSANLTGHAMEKNIEMGVLVSGGIVPLRAYELLSSLKTIGDISSINAKE